MKTSISGDLARKFKQANGSWPRLHPFSCTVAKSLLAYTYGQMSVATDYALSKSSTGHGNNIQCHGCACFVLLITTVPLTKANCPCNQKP